MTPIVNDSVFVASRDWLNWLSDKKSFRFELAVSFCDIKTGEECIDKTLSFTACVQGKKNYWYAHKRINGKLYRVYLGSAFDLSWDSLAAAAWNLYFLGLNAKESLIAIDKKEDSASSSLGEANKEINRLKRELVAITADRDRQLIRISEMQDKSRADYLQFTKDSRKAILSAESRISQLDWANSCLERQLAELAERQTKTAKSSPITPQESLEKFIYDNELSEKILRPRRYRNLTALARYRDWLSES